MNAVVLRDNSTSTGIICVTIGQQSHLSLVFPLMAAAARNAAKSADHTLYHLAPQGFWKKFREFNI